MNVYCVILRHASLVNVSLPRTKRCYLRAGAADRAIIAAGEEDAGWRPIGIEPSSMFAPFLEPDLSLPATDTGHAA
jgi:hypothetical protein